MNVAHEFPPPESYEDEARVVVPINGHVKADASANVIVFTQIHDIVAQAREPAWLLHKVLERRVLAVIAGARGTFKSFIALHWSMLMALQGHAGVILSGEGAGLDRRIAAWCALHRETLDLTTVPLVALERPLNLTGIAEMTALTDAIRALAKPVAFIVIDTLSKFSAGMDENDNSEMAAFLSALAEHLRDAFDCAVLLVAHTGHADGARPRGASSLMSNPDAEYIVKRPDPLGMTVTVSRERFKDTPTLPELVYEARVMDLGRVDSYGEPVTSLALTESDQSPPQLGQKYMGRNQEKFAIALREWRRNNLESTHLSSIDVDAMCKAQKLDRKRRREVLDTFVNARILTLSVGGFVLHPENL